MVQVMQELHGWGVGKLELYTGEYFSPFGFQYVVFCFPFATRGFVFVLFVFFFLLFLKIVSKI